MVLMHRLLVSNIQVQHKAATRLMPVMVHMSHILATSVANMSLILKSGDVELNPGPGRFQDLDYDSVDSSKVLGESDLNDVLREVIKLNASYYSLGGALGLLPAELNAIKSRYDQDLKQALNEVILAWLRQNYDTERYRLPTWRRLVEAVDNPAGGDNHALAKTIASSHPAVASGSLVKSVSMPDSHGSVKLQSGSHRQWVSEDYQHPPLQRQHRVKSTTHEASFDLTCDLEGAVMGTLQSQASHGGDQGLNSQQLALLSLVDRPSDRPISESTTTGAECSSEHYTIHLKCDVYQANSERQIECSMDEENRNTSPVHRDIKMKVKKFNAVPPCTPIFLRVSASKTCYVYIINIGSTGNMTTLIPNDCESENNLQARQYLQFPSREAGYTFELDEKSGKETIIVLAYDSALSKVDQAERDCANLMKLERKEQFRDIKIVKDQPPKGFLKVQFNVKSY